MATIILATTTSFIFWTIFGTIGGLALSFLLATLTEGKKPIHIFNFFNLVTKKREKVKRTITSKKQTEQVLKLPAVGSFESPKFPSKITSNKTRIGTNLLLLLIVENIWVFSEIPAID